MRLIATEKHEIIQQVTRSELGVKKTLEKYGISRSTFINGIRRAKGENRPKYEWKVGTEF